VPGQSYLKVLLESLLLDSGVLCGHYLQQNVFLAGDALMVKYPTRKGGCMNDLKVGLLGNCGRFDLEDRTGGEVVHDIPTALTKDILIFTGGEDIDPSLYGQKNRYCSYVNIERDIFEKSVLTMAIAYGVKVLGICRGHQLINAVLGGQLIQDIGMEFGLRHGPEKHDLRDRPNYWWDNESMAEIFPVLNSMHHQAVLNPGEGQHVICSSKDGVCEATANKTGTIVTVQFHPEWSEQGRNYFKKVMETGLLIW